jgi:hypothetical protein
MALDFERVLGRHVNRQEPFDHRKKGISPSSQHSCFYCMFLDGKQVPLETRSYI